MDAAANRPAHIEYNPTSRQRRGAIPESQEINIGAVKQKSNSLKWETFITHRGSLSRDAPPGKEHLKWVPNTVTLISGEKDAVLVDVFLTIDASKQLVDWVAASGKSLTTIYITHAHGDPFFGLQPVLDRFPKPA